MKIDIRKICFFLIVLIDKIYQTNHLYSTSKKIYQQESFPQEKRAAQIRDLIREMKIAKKSGDLLERIGRNGD